MARYGSICAILLSGLSQPDSAGLLVDRGRIRTVRAGISRPAVRDARSGAAVFQDGF